MRPSMKSSRPVESGCVILSIRFGKNTTQLIQSVRSCHLPWINLEEFTATRKLERDFWFFVVNRLPGFPSLPIRTTRLCPVAISLLLRLQAFGNFRDRAEVLLEADVGVLLARHEARGALVAALLIGVFPERVDALRVSDVVDGPYVGAPDEGVLHR